jgi:hypothetical protein
MILKPDDPIQNNNAQRLFRESNIESRSMTLLCTTGMKPQFPVSKFPERDTPQSHRIDKLEVEKLTE